MLLSAPLIIPPYEIMQLQTSIRSCEGNHYVVTVINDAAENSGLLSNNPCAQGAFEGRGPVAKETDDIQNGPCSTVILSSFSCLALFLPPTNRFFFSLPPFSSFFCFQTSCHATFASGGFLGFFLVWCCVFFSEGVLESLETAVQFVFLFILISLSS